MVPHSLYGADAGGSDADEDLFVHPFFAHMSLADPVGTASFRFTALHRKIDEGDSKGDFAAHIEAGLLPNLGIHIRNDAVREESYSEVMLMYNTYVAPDHNFGTSIFGQVSIPTGEDVDNDYKGLFGFGIYKALPPVVAFNGNMHYNPEDNMAEYEGAFVFRASDFLYPVFEVRGEITEDYTSAYILPGLKFRVRENQTIGAGVQIGVSNTREYDNEILLQYGVEF
jgi:hypothetical protein